MKRVTVHPFRRTAIVSLLALVASVGAFFVAPGAEAEEEFIAGSGQGKATTVKVGPAAAQLSLAPTFGVALADHVGTVGRGLAVPFDYVALDGTVNNNAREMKAEFPELLLRSTDDGAARGVRWEPKPGLIEDAQATDAPVGRSSIQFEGFQIPGFIEVDGVQSRAFSGVYTRTVDGQSQLVRAAGGTVDIGRIALLGGMFDLRDLHWEGAQITDRNDDSEPETIGKFVVGRATFPGSDGPERFEEISSDQDMGALFGPLNEALAATGTGLRIDPPRVGMTAGVVTVSPLAIRVVNASAFRGLFDNDLYQAFQDQVRTPVSEQFIAECQAGEGGESEEEGEGDEGEGGGGGTGLPLGRPALLATHDGDHEEFDEFENDGPTGEKGEPDPFIPAGSGSSDCGVPFLVADLAVGVISGAGRLDLEFGGVLGTTEGETFEGFNFDFEFGDFGDGGFAVDDTPAPSDQPTFVAGSQATNPNPNPAPTVDTSGGTQTASPVLDTATPPATGPQVVRLTGSRASAAAAVGIVGLAAAAAMGMTDYRRLRVRRQAVNPIS